MANPADDHIHKHIDTYCKVVGNGGCSKKVSFGDVGVGGLAIASASDSLAEGGGKGAPAESRQMGKVRSIGVAKKG